MKIAPEELKQLLIKNNLVTEASFYQMSEYAKKTDTSLEEVLIQKDIISDEQLGMLLADHFKFPFVNLSKISIPDGSFKIVPERIARGQKVIAFEHSATGVKLAMVDPENAELREMIAKKTGRQVIPYLATERDIFNTLKIYKKDLQKFYDNLASSVNSPTRAQPTIVPIAKVVDEIINYAYHDKASDIHIEPVEKESLVRFRIDGILHDVLVYPKNLHDQIVTRIKVLSRLRTDEHLTPQDGKMRMKFDEETIDLRVSILPVADGEKIVLRILSSKMQSYSLYDMDLSQNDLKKMENAFTKSFGMILCTGPTGSGKTTTIYGILKILNTREKNITTIEDPVEYRISGVNQIQVNAKTNLTFASGLRSILRQDPNIVFVGEIRDNETAGIAVNAALTGHLVLSTLHTNDSATALPRLIDMKVEPFLVATTVNVIIAQRLIRRICEMCKASFMLTREQLLKNLPQDVVIRHFENNQQVRFYKGNGCKVCHGTGYSGRVGIFEVLEVTKEVRKLINEKNDSDVILQKAIEEGMTTMLDDGLNKVIKGITTFEEVLRVTKVDIGS